MPSSPSRPRPPAPARPDAILYFGNDFAAENRTSSHHIARWLARRTRLIYLECPGLRAPRGDGRDLRKSLAKLRTALLGPRRADGGVEVQTLLQIPFHRSALVRRLNRTLLLARLRWLMRRHGIRRPLAWFVVPHLAPVVGRLGEVASVYYCTDEHSSLPDVDAAAVRAMDDDLTRRADLVFVTSETLLARKLRQNPRTFHSPHGVDLEHFRRALDLGRPVPQEIAHLRGPVVGFCGLIERWIDLDLVATLADRRPEWTFLMIGRIAVPESEVPRRPNILFLGKRPYETLPDYGRRFDVALIPYRLTRQVLHANPLKLREYLAMGKPIVSVSTPEIDAFADVVEIARSPDEFLARLDRVIAEGPSRERAARQIARVAPMTWDARLGRVIEMVEHHLMLDPLSPAAAPPPRPGAEVPPSP